MQAQWWYCAEQVSVLTYSQVDNPRYEFQIESVDPVIKKKTRQCGFFFLVPRIGFEPMTYGLEGRCQAESKKGCSFLRPFFHANICQCLTRHIP